MTAGAGGLGLCAAITALIQGTLGLLLIERARALATSDSSRAESWLTFGEPISHYASALAILAVVIAWVATVGSIDLSPDLMRISRFLREFDAAQLFPAAATLLISAAVCVFTVRAKRLISWLYAAVVFGSVGLCLLLASQTGWSLGTMGVTTLVVMNLLVVLARIVRSNRQRVASLLHVPESSCHRPFIEVPLLVTAGLLILQIGLLTGVLTDPGTASLEWPWLWVNLLGGSLFFHSMYLLPNSAIAHLLVASSIVGVLGVCQSSGAVLTPDVSLAIVALGWGTVAALLNRARGKALLARFGLPLCSSDRVQGEQILVRWSIGLMVVSVASALPIGLMIHPNFPNVAITLLVATVACHVGWTALAECSW